MRDFSDSDVPRERGARWGSALMLPIWLAAAVVAFLPFAFDASAWDAVTFRVPGNQGNWWHALVGAPFFLPYPMIWLRLRELFASQPLSTMRRRMIWSVVILSIAGTTSVETPFLLHLAGTSDWQRFLVLGLGFGIILCSVAVLLLRRRHIPSVPACTAALDTAYLANAALCLIVYSEATGSTWSRLGWFVSIVLVWPIALELVSILAGSLRGRSMRADAKAT